jgi:hypothetical protein
LKNNKKGVQKPSYIIDGSINQVRQCSKLQKPARAEFAVSDWRVSNGPKKTHG